MQNSLAKSIDNQSQVVKKDFQIKVGSQRKVKQLIDSKLSENQQPFNYNDSNSSLQEVAKQDNSGSNSKAYNQMMQHRRMSQALDKTIKDKKDAKLEIPGRIQISSQHDLKINRPMSSPTKLKRNPQTPTRRPKYEDEDAEDDQIIDQDDSDDSLSNESKNDIDSNEDEQMDDFENDEQLQLAKKKELEDMKKFAHQNGFSITIEEEKPKPVVKSFVITKEMLDEQQKLDQLRFQKNMYVPPPLEILSRKYTNKEPVRTGFNQGLIPIKIRNNLEYQRAPQGPQIIVTTQSAMKVRERESFSRDTKSRAQSRGARSISRESSMSRQEMKKEPTTAADQDNGQEQAQEFVYQNKQMETSLRHFFYLEYKSKFQDNETNPIVYSRFGKTHYNSNEKFDTNNFNQLIRTCNLKKLLKSNETVSLTTNPKDKKFSEPISFPLGNYYQLKHKQDKTLIFESRFESGNLQLAHKTSENEYDLILQNDINSKGHTQWFYFRVSNVRKGQKVKFNLINLIKSKSLYNEGMKVLIYSEKNQANSQKINEEEQSGWTRGGEDLSYYQNNYRKEHQQNQQRYYYTFSFCHTFEFDEDDVYFAYSQPYTYTDLTDYLCEIQSKQLNFISRNTLCRTIAGNKCEYLTITNRVPYEVDRKKEAVILTARTHPGESNASWMMKGAIDFLISDDSQAVELRDKFVFKIVPMLNPDGVINGNYRCSLAGCDLNRRWKFPSEMLHPTIFHTKKLIMNLCKERPLALYCDLHGHSRRKNIFMYGNNMYDNPDACRVFPYLMSKISQPHFSYDYSRFNVGRTKEHTARIAVWRDLNSEHANIFTMEASFCGPKYVKYEPHRGNKKIAPSGELNYHFNTFDLQNAGSNLSKTLLLYREQKESSMGLGPVEYQVQQFHIDKEAKLEQEELIRQQQLLVDQRKMMEQQNKLKGPNMEVDLSNLKLSTSKEQALKQIQNNFSAKKMIKKFKTEACDDNAITQTQNEKKKKINYNLKDKEDESDAQSDSEPSDDNLKDDELLKLIPKKYGKKKYLKGLEDKKKKPAQTEKKVDKKPKTQLMPCMSQKKDKELKSTRQASESTAKKIVAQKNPYALVTKLINCGKQRDVGTTIHYKGDGINLSLMELDILRHTGCQWSKTIYPGYKGYVKPQDKFDFRSSEKQDGLIDYRVRSQNLSNMSPINDNLISNISKNLMNTFIENNEKLRNSSNKSAYSKEELNNNSLTAKRESLRLNPFSNEKLANQTEIFKTTEESSSISIQNLQKKIKDANMSESKSLFKGYQRGNASNGKQQNKVKGLPFEYYDTKDQKPEQKVYETNLETVMENTKDKQLFTLDMKDHNAEAIMSIKNQLQTNKNSIAKKVLNGSIVQTFSANVTLSHQKLKNGDQPKLRLRRGSNGVPAKLSSQSSCRKGRSESFNNLNLQPESKTSLTAAAQQILNSSYSGKNENRVLSNQRTKVTEFKGEQMGIGLVGELVNHDFTLQNQNKLKQYSDLATIAPSQMMNQMAKLKHDYVRKNSQLSNSFNI